MVPIPTLPLSAVPPVSSSLLTVRNVSMSSQISNLLPDVPRATERISKLPFPLVVSESLMIASGVPEIPEICNPLPILKLGLTVPIPTLPSPLIIKSLSLPLAPIVILFNVGVAEGRNDIYASDVIPSLKCSSARFPETPESIRN